jgi:hypothetical protein
MLSPSVDSVIHTPLIPFSSHGVPYFRVLGSYFLLFLLCTAGALTDFWSMSELQTLRRYNVTTCGSFFAKCIPIPLIKETSGMKTLYIQTYVLIP